MGNHLPSKSKPNSPRSSIQGSPMSRSDSPVRRPLGVPDTGGSFLPGERNVPKPLRIFVNRNLKMRRIRALGFDMDHTLALYNRQTFEQLTFDLAVEALIRDKDYPDAVRDIPYDPDFILRGLIVDKRFGNLLKMNAHNYIARVYHGTHEVPKELRRRHYRTSRVNLRKNRYQSFDTLFSMPEGSLFAALVDLKRADKAGPLRDIPLANIFDDVRDSVDSIHRDGTLKNVIMQDLGKYFIPDPNLRPTLQRFRALGKKLFLVTNSEHAYTEAVMSHVLSDHAKGWKDLFDLVIVQSRKPGFFSDGVEAEELDRNVFQGANAAFVERKLGAKGDELLYFGDHTYGDILRGKKTVGWRTAMIVHELEHEVDIHDQQSLMRGEIEDLVGRRKDLARDRDQIELLLATMEPLARSPQVLRNGIPPWAGEFTRRELVAPKGKLLLASRCSMRAGLDFLLDTTVRRTQELEHQAQAAFNPYWGHLFREGNELSRFGRQVREFACIYSSRVSNFLHYPVNYYFIAPHDRMPHER